MQDKDMSILTQVAFKEAAANYRAKGFSVVENAAAFIDEVSVLTDVLVAEVNGRVEAMRGTPVNAPQKAAATVGAPQQFNAEAAMSEAFGATPAPFEITAKNGLNNGEPLPAWLYDACSAVGETEVYDNRGEVAGTRKPHFRAVNAKDDSGRPQGFWPPSNK